MNNEVIVRIDISTEAGRRVLLRLEKEESVKIEYLVLENELT